MSQCHVRSHLTLMSALLRQQVGLSAKAVHFHPPVLRPRHASQPPYIRYPPQNIGCSDMETDSLALASTFENTVYHSTLENPLEISAYGDGQCLFTSLSAPVTSPLRQLKKIEHDVIASKSARRGDCLYQCFSIRSTHLYRIFTISSAI